ncbi:MAG TPA: mandelate racemase/muconate lactonizing enzyme family protein [Thermoleophilia bacterium]|nr:mandelate racemase/muconate lactonizing enzyme family protein [Thermoleophilia bacterium]
MPAWGRGRVQSVLELVLHEVIADDGLVGLGVAGGGLAEALAVERLVAPHFVGQDPANIERLAQVLRDAEIMGPPLYCMEIPLWDLLGKAAGMPVFRLWGGSQCRVRAYCSTGEVRSPEVRAEDVARLAAEGYTAVKLRFHREDPRDDVAVAEAVRARVGDAMELMVDANQASADPGHGGHWMWDFHTALGVARELERLGVAWLEEPLPRHDYSGLARLRDRLESLKLAGGEDNHGLHEFQLLLERGCYDILQPDAMKSETLSAIRKLAAFAELAGVQVVPHTWGNGLALLVHLHLAASLPGRAYIEFPHDPPSGVTASARDQMLAETLTIDDLGFVHVPERPGFGFVLDEERVTRHTLHTVEYGDCGSAVAT